MIGSVQNITFGNIPAETKKNNNFFLDATTAKDIFEKKIKDDDKKGRKVGIIIAGSAILAAAAMLVVTRRLPKGTAKRVQDLIQRLEERVSKRTAQGKTGIITNFYKYSLQKLAKFGERAKSINNISSYKDLLFKKLMSKTKLTRKIHAKTTSFFERLARRTVKRKYAKSTGKFTQLFESFDDVNKKIAAQNRLVKIGNVEKTGAQWAEEIKKHQKDLNKVLKENFGQDALNKRYLKMKRANDGLDKKVYETGKDGINKLKKLQGSKLNQTFIAEEFLAPEKIALNKETGRLRNAVSYTVSDNYKNSKEILNNIYMVVDPKDAEANKIIKSLRSKLSAYKKIPPEQKTVLSAVNNEISNDLNKLSEILKKSNYNKDAIGEIQSSIKELNDLMSKTPEGSLQKILEIYKGILPEKEYTKLLGKSNNAVKTLDKAINTENDKFFDKLRDLNLGSGPTDALSLVGAVGGVGLGLTKADNNDERKSAMLKYGIPVIGGVATSLLLTVSLVSAFKALAISSISSLVVGDIGVKLDKYRKRHHKKVEDDKHAKAVKAEIEAKTGTEVKSGTEAKTA